jgi:hypothetical protein
LQRLQGEAGANSTLDGNDFSFINGNRRLGYSNDEDNPGYRQDWQPIQRVEPAKEIPWKDWLFYFFESVGPSPPTLV